MEWGSGGVDLQGVTIPNHLAVIPDGNRRWAAEHQLTVMDGHRAGFEIAKRLSRFCRKIGIHTVTVWAFSTENWRRSPEQVSALMLLYEEWIAELLPEAIEEEVRVVHLGRIDGLPEGLDAVGAAAGFPNGLPDSLITALHDIQAKTAGYDRNVINLAINYGGSDELKRGISRMLWHAKQVGLDPATLDVDRFLDTSDQPHPNPDLVWRTSGEVRSSGFLPLQSAYAEMVFTPKLFPDLVEEDLLETVREYSARVRRFGG